MTSESTEKKLPTVAILGAGTMGSGMAHRLLSRGFELTVFARNAETRKTFEKAGARTAETPGRAVENVDVIVSMVSDDVASQAVWLGEQGALRQLKPGSVSIESSTLSPDFVLKLGEEFDVKQREFLDAPVTGSKPQAAGGELLFLVGGSGDALEKARPVLDVLGRKTLHLGPLGSGARMKLINNMLCAVQASGLAEALVLAEKSGLAMDSVLDVLTNGAPGSPLVKNLSKRMMDRNYEVNFFLRHMAKDVQYAIDLSKGCRASHETADVALDLLDNAKSQGYGEKDFSSLIEPLRT